MEGFIGREGELARLQEIYEEEGSSTCAVYGRRRIGKTMLLRRFCEDKPHLYTQVVGGTPEMTMEVLREDLGAFLGRDVSDVGSPLELLRALESLDPGRKTVIVIDEFPVLVDMFPETPGLLQRFIDHRMTGLNIMLIVCGSSIKAMLSEVEDPGRPLFGRFGPRIRVGPMPYRDARLFHPGMSEEDRVRMYAIASGVPYYHRRMDRPTVEGNIAKAFLGEGGELADEADATLQRETDSWRNSRAVVTAIATGKRTEPAIRDATGLSINTCRSHLEALRLLGIVDSRPNWGCSKPQLYEIVDGMQLFHRQVLMGRERLLASGDVKTSYDALTPFLSAFYGRRFERICLEYLTGTERVEDAGSWSGRVPRPGHDHGPRETADIDIVAYIREGDGVVTAFGECKFTSRRCGTEVAEELIRRSWHVSGDRNRRYYIFSRSGFLPELEELADDGADDIRLVSVDDFRAWAEGGTQRKYDRLLG